MRGVGAVLALAVLLGAASAGAEPSPLEVRVSAGASFVRFGEARATGGWGPMIGVEVGSLRLGDTDFEVSYRNTLMLFNFTSTTWLGAVDTNAVLISRSWSRYRVWIGPAAELLTIPLCNNDGWCSRSTGIAPAAACEIGGTFGKSGKGAGLAIGGALRYVPSEVGSWLTFGMTASGTFAL